MDNVFETTIDTINIKVGDFIKLYDGTYKVTKKTKTALALQRYFWYNRILDWIFKEKPRNDPFRPA